MKKNKKLVSTVVLLTMVLSLYFTAFASKPTDTTSIDIALLERGYPQIVLDTMDSGAKEELYNEPDLYFAGTELIFYDEESGTFQEMSISDNGIMPMGQIPTADLSLNWTTSISKNNDDSVKNVDVKYSYNWRNLPFFRWQDPIAISWDDEKFRIKDNSFYKIDKYDGNYINSSGMPTGSFTGKVKSEEYGYASAYSAGVTWYADLKGYDILLVATKLYGYGSFKLEPISTTYNGSTTLYGKYVHPTASASIGINIGSYGAFSVTGGSNYDERGNQKTISWRK